MSEADDRAGLLVLGRFRLQRRIGGGAMGDVYVATHEGLGRLVAVKILRSSARPASRARFRREATIAARLAGAHVVRVTDFGELPDGAPFLVMDFVDGPTLADELASRGTLPVRDAVGRCLEICEALAEAHGAGIVHRDIKPANLLLARSPDGTRVLRVADFGVAKAEGESTLTGDGASLGSPSYMAPEQIVDPHGVDARADLWAVGVVLFELLTGERPFDGPTVPATLMAVARGNAPRVDHVRPEVPAGLADVVDTCLQGDPTRRHESAATLAEALAPFGPEGSALIAARIRRVGAASVTNETTTLDPDAPRAPSAAPANATTVTGGVTTPPHTPSLPVLAVEPRARLRRFVWPTIVAGSCVAALVLARLPGAPPPVVLPSTPPPSLSVNGQSDRPAPSAEAGGAPGVLELVAEASAALPASPAPGTATATRLVTRGGRGIEKPAAPPAPPKTAAPAPSSAASGQPSHAQPAPRVLTTEVDDLGPRK